MFVENVKMQHLFKNLCDIQFKSGEQFTAGDGLSDFTGVYGTIGAMYHDVSGIVRT